MKSFLEKFSVKEKEIFKKWLDNIVNKILFNPSFKKKIIKNNFLALESLDSNIAKKFSLKIEKNKDNRASINFSENTLIISLPENDNLNEQDLETINGGLTTLIEVRRDQKGKIYYAEGTVATDGNLNVDLNEQTGAFRLRTSN